jgi:hypothetical protein
VRGDLVADGGADQVGAVGVEPFLHKKIDLAEVDEAHVDRDLLVDGLGVGGGAEGWHDAILPPSTWMFKLNFRQEKAGQARLSLEAAGAQAERRRRAITPTMPMPASKSAMLAGSGTTATPLSL